MTAQLIVIYWRDIPTQVNAQMGRVRHRVPLPHRFMRAVGQAAMVAEIHTSHEYTLQWRRETRACGTDLEAEATTEAARINTVFTRAHLAAVVSTGGFEPANTPQTPTRLGQRATAPATRLGQKATLVWEDPQIANVPKREPSSDPFL